MSNLPTGGKDGGGQDDEHSTDGAGDARGVDDRTPNERPSGRHADGAANGRSPDHGASIVTDFIAVGLSDLGHPSGGVLARLRDDLEGLRIDTERFRVDTERAGHFLRLFGPDQSRPFRAELRTKRRLIERQRQLIEHRTRVIDRLFLVCEIDLPPESP
jgi:hypothetical protein